MCTLGETTSEQNRARDYSKNVRFLCYEGSDVKNDKKILWPFRVGAQSWS